jgi:hypothetical protein
MRTISVFAFSLALAFSGKSHAAEIDWPKVDAALGKTASMQGEVHRYGIPRSDLQVTQALDCDEPSFMRTRPRTPLPGGGLPSWRIAAWAPNESSSV